jgi:CheY-like chemotaxis protein
MPEMDGLTAAKHIRTRKELQWMPILALTAHAMNEDRQKSLAAGMNGHITKPINHIELFQTLAAWLKKGQQARSKAISLEELEYL